MTIVVNGQRTDVNLLEETPSPTPRQLFALRGGGPILQTPTSMPGGGGGGYY